MARLRADDIAAWSGGRWKGTPPGSLTRFSHDTRTLQPGACFVALKTGSRDGHDFLNAAREAGALAAIVERPIEDCPLPQLIVPDSLKAFQQIASAYRRFYRGQVVGITGSCGKTTTKDLTAALLGEATLKTDGNFNNYLGVPLTLTCIDPEVHDFAVVEAGINEPGEMDMLAEMIWADVAIITAIAPAHLEKLGSVEGVAREKVRLIELAKPGSVLFCPSECLEHEAVRVLGSRVSMARYAQSPQYNLNGQEEIIYDYEVISREKSRVTFLSEGKSLEVPFVSPGLISDAVLAISAARYLGVNWDDCVKRVNNWQRGYHRGVWIHGEGLSIYDDSYNANPASMAEALSVFEQGADEALPRLYVLGGMRELGDASYELHVKTGDLIPWRDGDRVILIGKEATGYRDGLLKKAIPDGAVRVFDSAEEAGDVIRNFRGAVFLKGSRGYGLERLLDYFSY